MATNITDFVNGTFKPRVAVVVYESGHGYYLESHLVQPNGKLGAGRPMQVEHIADVVEYFADKQKAGSYIHGRIPANLLMCQWSAKRKLLVWYNAPQPRQMYFDAELEIPNGEAMQPGLLYVADGNSLDVYALAELPHDNAVLYRAPYHNVSNGGSVCLGSAKVKAPTNVTYANRIAMWEQLFWQSNFTHNTDDSPIKGNLNSYWVSSINSGKVFPVEILLAIENGPKTVGELLNQLDK